MDLSDGLEQLPSHHPIKESSRFSIYWIDGGKIELRYLHPNKKVKPASVRRSAI
jgi:hypothetical protein